MAAVGAIAQESERRREGRLGLAGGEGGGGRVLEAGEGEGLTVVKPAILFLSRFDWMIATSSHTRLLVSKSSVSRL